MGIKTNLKDLRPRKQVYKREIQLLSRGFSAPTAWPDGKLTVFPWDSDVDAYLMEQTKAGKGNLLYGILERVCNLNGASVDQFVFSEINAILLLSRALQFSGTIEYESTCPFCRNSVREVIQVPHELRPIGEKQTGYTGFDDIVLPDCADRVRLRPLLVSDHKKIEDRSKSNWNLFSERHLQILLPVVSVNDGAPDTIEELATWYNALSPEDAKFLEIQEMELSPHLDTKIPHKCQECAREFYHSLMFDQEFFRQRSRGLSKPPLAQNILTGVGREGTANQPAKPA